MGLFGGGNSDSTTINNTSTDASNKQADGGAIIAGHSVTVSDHGAVESSMVTARKALDANYAMAHEVMDLSGEVSARSSQSAMAFASGLADRALSILPSLPAKSISDGVAQSQGSLLDRYLVPGLWVAAAALGLFTLRKGG